MNKKIELEKLKLYVLDEQIDSNKTISKAFFGQKMPRLWYEIISENDEAMMFRIEDNIGNFAEVQVLIDSYDFELIFLFRGFYKIPIYNRTC